MEEKTILKNRIRSIISKHFLRREVDAILGESDRKMLKSILKQIPNADKITTEDAETWVHRITELHFNPAPHISDVASMVSEYYSPYKQHYEPGEKEIIHYYALPVLYLALREGKTSEEDLQSRGIYIYKPGEFDYEIGHEIEWNVLENHYNALKNAGVERPGTLHYNVIERAGKLRHELKDTVDLYAGSGILAALAGTGWLGLHAAFGHETEHPVFLAIGLAHYAGAAFAGYKFSKNFDKYAELVNPETFIRTAAREIASEMGKKVGQNVKEKELKHHIIHAAKLIDHQDPIIRTFARHALKEMIRRIKE